MKLDRQTVARVSAQWNSWPPEEFASCAEKRSVYQPVSGCGFGFFAIERGERNPSLKNIDSIANALRISLAELFIFGKGKPGTKKP